MEEVTLDHVDVDQEVFEDEDKPEMEPEADKKLNLCLLCSLVGNQGQGI